MKYIATIGEQQYTVEVLDEKRILLDNVLYEVDFESVSNQPVFSLIVDGKSHEAYVSFSDNAWDVLLEGNLFTVQVEDEREKRLRAASGGQIAERGEFHLKAPMPGLIVALPVEEGQTVKKGDILVILESMKMQNELRSPCAGKVSRIRVRPGDSVEQKQTMLSVV